MRKATTALVISIMGIGITAAMGCSAPDPGVLTYETSPSQSGSNTQTGKDSGTNNLPPTNNNTDAGTGGGVDSSIGAGGDDTGAPSGGSSFLGETTPWTSQPAAASARAKHQSAGQAPQTAGTECLACHGTGGPGVQFLAAGFVGSAASSTDGAGDVEVRVWSAASQAGASTHSDGDGFFWIKPTGTNIAAPFNVGVRDATQTRLMPPDAPGGGCNGSSCHGGGQGPVHL